MPLLHTANQPSQPSVCELDLEFFWISADIAQKIDPKQERDWNDVVHDSVGMVCMGGEL